MSTKRLSASRCISCSILANCGPRSTRSRKDPESQKAKLRQTGVKCKLFIGRAPNIFQQPSHLQLEPMKRRNRTELEPISSQSPASSPTLVPYRSLKAEQIWTDLWAKLRRRQFLQSLDFSLWSCRPWLTICWCKRLCSKMFASRFSQASMSVTFRTKVTSYPMCLQSVND